MTRSLTGADWEYAPAPESREIVTIQREYGLFVDGDFAAPLSGEHFTTLNPASEEPLASVAQAGEADVDKAVASARKAFETSWGRLPPRGPRRPGRPWPPWPAAPRWPGSA